MNDRPKTRSPRGNRVGKSTAPDPARAASSASASPRASDDADVHETCLKIAKEVLSQLSWNKDVYILSYTTIKLSHGAYFGMAIGRKNRYIRTNECFEIERTYRSVPDSFAEVKSIVREAFYKLDIRGTGET